MLATRRCLQRSMWYPWGAMPRQDKGGRYHHGNLRAALIQSAVELIAERGLRDFSLAEVSRRIGVAVSAPYAHFADRDELLAAVAVRAWEVFYAEVEREIAPFQQPTDRLAAMAGAYVRFAAHYRPLFEVLYGAALDKHLHPEIEEAERPLMAALLTSVRALSEGEDDQADDLVIALEATALGHAMLLFYGDFGQGQEAVEDAAERAARAILALIQGRHRLGHPADPLVR
jgi:AcrR family transcriptional regulator